MKWRMFYRTQNIEMVSHHCEPSYVSQDGVSKGHLSRDLPISVNHFSISVNILPVSRNDLPISVNELAISGNDLPKSVNQAIYRYR